MASVILSVCFGHCSARRGLWGRRGADIFLQCFLVSLGLEDMQWYLTELHAFCLPVVTKRYLFLLMCDASVCLDNVAELAVWCISPCMPCALSSGHLFYYPSDMVCHFLLQKVELFLLVEWLEGNIMQRDEGKWRNTQFCECYR